MNCIYRNEGASYQSTSGLVQEKNTRTGDQFTSNSNSALLPTRDTTALTLFRANNLILNMIDSQLSLNVQGPLLLGSPAHIARQSEQSAGQDGLMHGQGWEHCVFLIDKADHTLEVGVGDLFTVDVEVTLNGTALILARQYVQEGGLAGT